eukprot:scaffold1112_cov92-Amphora_coffeaeformis.AAC.3
MVATAKRTHQGHGQKRRVVPLEDIISFAKANGVPRQRRSRGRSLLFFIPPCRGHQNNLEIDADLHRSSIFSRRPPVKVLQHSLFEDELFSFEMATMISRVLHRTWRIPTLCYGRQC